MGTRGAFGFFKDGVHKVTYNHFDSYPSELGKHVLDIAKQFSIDELNKMFDRIEMVDMDSTPTPGQIEKCRKYINLNVSTQSETDWYCLLREAQGDLSAYAEVGLMIEYAGFLHASLFCEYAYIINLTDNTLEVYEGFQKEKPVGRYADVPPDPDNGYYAVTLVKAYPLNALPDSLEEAFAG